MVRVFHFFPPEAAHRLVIFLLKIYQKLFSIAKEPISQFPVIKIKSLPQLTFRSGVGLAAGFDKNAEVFPALFKLGFGFIEVGTVTPLPQKGNEGVRIFRIPGKEALVNRLGFNNCGSDLFESHLQKLKTKNLQSPLWVNIGKGRDSADPLRDYLTLEKKLSPFADAFVINVSSPNTPGLRDLQSEAFLESLNKSLSFEKPILVKLAPDLSNETLKQLCEYLKSSRVCGVVLTKNSRQFASAHYPEGGFSGPDLFERSYECVSLAKEILTDEKVIVGVGGVTSRERAAKMKKAGASLVEIYTGFIYQGPKLIREIASVFDSA